MINEKEITSLLDAIKKEFGDEKYELAKKAVDENEDGIFISLTLASIIWVAATEKLLILSQQTPSEKIAGGIIQEGQMWITK